VTKLVATILACGLSALLGACSKGAETSVEFDVTRIRVLFDAIHPSIESGLGEPQVMQIERDFAALPADATKELNFPIVAAGTSSELRIRIRKEDVDAVEMHFIGNPEVITKIQEIIRKTPLDVN
jgi:hypothetical protein